VPLGYRVIQSISRPDPALVAALGQHYSADLADAMKKHGAMSMAIRPVYRPMPRIAGPAVTACLPTSSFSMAKMAMDQCRPGDVLVLNAHEDTRHALFGGHIAHALKVRELAGVIVDGAIRDVSELQDEALRVFARGTALIVGGHDGPGEVNVPIACGGVVVNPGDIIVADEDGIVVIPRQDAAIVLSQVEALVGRHHASDEKYGRGEIPGNADIAARLQKDGCEFIEQPVTA
jgi:regulator of RNase E activity RraA